MWIASSLETIRTPTCIALGNFDGIHRGHRRVVEPILAARPLFEESEREADLERYLVGARPSRGHSADDSEPIPRLEGDRPQPVPYATVVTFWPHPRAFFSGQPQPLLTPLAEKAQILETMGIEQLVLLPFTQELANLTPEEFFKEIVVDRLQARFISVGQDFCFGRQRAGTTQDLQAIATRYNIATHIISLQCEQGERISSSAIRHALAAGDLNQATQLLGRPYRLIGDVVSGQQVGRTIGFPTANLQMPSDKFLPRQGVYAVWVRIGTERPPQPGVMNLGVRPTVDGTRQTVEVHLLDWSGQLYGQTLHVDLVTFLRPEQRFSGLDALKAQIQQDCMAARSLLHQPE